MFGIQTREKRTFQVSSEPVGTVRIEAGVHCGKNVVEIIDNADSRSENRAEKVLARPNIDAPTIKS